MPNNLTAYFNLKETDDYQFIYATKDLISKTFYCVYAKLIIENEIVMGIELFLKNYNSVVKHKFMKNTNDCIYCEDDIIRIGCETGFFGSSYENKLTLTKQIEVSKLKGIFFTKFPKKYAFELEQGDLGSLRSTTLEPENEDFDFIKDRSFSENISREQLMAVGGNCRVSLVRTENWVE